MVEAIKSAATYLFGAAGAEKTPEDADPEKALRQMLDDHGEFHLEEEDNTFKTEDLKVFHAAITR